MTLKTRQRCATRWCAVSAAVVLCGAWAPGAFADQWRQSSYEDFSHGTSDDGGVNLYAAADGTVRTIYTFDYDRDGHNDIYIGSGHDNWYAPPTYIYRNVAEGVLDRRFRWLLLSDGAHSGAFADVNADGWLDAVLCGTSNGANSEALDAIIYFGSERGYSTRASTRLPTYYSKCVAVIDADGDGHDDLAFAQGREPGLVVYYNRDGGFDASRRRAIHCPAITDAHAADIDDDGYTDLLALAGSDLLVFAGSSDGIATQPSREHSLDGSGRFALANLNSDGRLDIAVTKNTVEGGGIVIHYADAHGGFAGSEPAWLPGIAPHGVAAADLNRDGHADLIVANFGHDNGTGDAPTSIYWGSADGFSGDHRLDLQTRFARAVKTADLNADHWPDLVIACYRNAESHQVDSLVYLSDQGQFSDDHRIGLPTVGAVDIAIGDVSGDGRSDVMFFNAVDGTYGLTDSLIYFNDGRGHFSRDRAQTIEARDPFAHVASDFNLDGHLDVLIANSFEYGRFREEGSYLYWGSGERRADWTPERRTNIATDFAVGVVAGDLNRDGWLDLAFSQIGRSVDDRVKFDQSDAHSPVFYGSADGFSDQRVTWLPVANPRGLTLADLNQDGWIDLIYSNLNHETIPIFWGSADGYAADRRSDLAVPGNGSVTVNCADVNADGRLDILVSCFYDYSTTPTRSDHFSYVFLGSPDGFDTSRRIKLQTMAATQSTIADFDKDGRLDIFIPNYANTFRHRTWSSYLYYNGPSGFDNARRTSLFTHSGSFGLPLDFNGDGWLDLAVGSHMQQNGNHRSYSQVFFGSADGFTEYSRIEFPTDGAHESTFVDPGHIYHRRHEFIFTSDVFDAGRAVIVRDASFIADTPHGSTISLEIRCADEQGAIESEPWEALPAPSKASTSKLTGRYVQYRAIFKSRDGSNYPVLHEVSIDYE